MMFDEENGPAWGWAGGPQGPRHEQGPWGFGFGGLGMGERGPWGRGPGMGGPPFRNFWGMFGPGGRRGPNMYGRGDLKYVLLELLKEQPKHGYEMIKDLEGRAGGFYTPSAGAVYPTLQLMEDRGWVTSATVEGKKVYTITDTGRAALEERSAQEQPFGPGHEHHHRHGPRGPFGPNAGPELGALGRESIEVARLMRDAVMTSNGDPVRLTQLRTIMEQTQAALRAFLQQGAPTPNEPPAEKPPEMV